MALARLSAAAFVAAYVLVSFSTTPNPMMGLWRPLLVGVGIGVALQLVLSLALRDRDRAALAASVIVLVLSAAWVPLAVAVVAATWLVAIQWRRQRLGQPLLGVNAGMLSRNLAIFAVAFAAAAAVPVVGWAITSAQAVHGSAPGASAKGEPDVVVLLLDAYPRRDSLMQQFGFDNSGFEAELASRGFRVAAHSRSNYTATWATMASMFNGRYLEEIPLLNPTPSDAAEQYRRAMLAIASSPVLDGFRRDGYEIVTVPSPFESAALTTADRILAPPELTSFELSLLQHSLLGQVAFRLAPEIAFDQHRARLQSTLRILADEIERPSSSPRFVFAHLLLPHAPLVYRADGSAAEPEPCFPDCSIYAFLSPADWDGFAGQVEHLNQLVLPILDEIVASDPDAIVIVMSDHGSHRPGSDPAMAFRNFFAARVPDNPTAFEDDVTPLTAIARLTGVDFTPGDPYRGWYSEPLEPLTLTPYTGTEP